MAVRPGRFDKAARRKSTRSGRARGARILIAAEELEACGIDPNGPPPEFRVWTGERGRIVVTFYPADLTP